MARISNVSDFGHSVSPRELQQFLVETAAADLRPAGEYLMGVDHAAGFIPPIKTKYKTTEVIQSLATVGLNSSSKPFKPTSPAEYAQAAETMRQLLESAMLQEQTRTFGGLAAGLPPSGEGQRATSGREALAEFRQAAGLQSRERSLREAEDAAALLASVLQTYVPRSRPASPAAAAARPATIDPPPEVPAACREAPATRAVRRLRLPDPDPETKSGT